jgi:hypothetical protein
MGHFDPRYVTHLILDTPSGSKYWNWKRHLELYRQYQNQQQQQQQQQQPSKQQCQHLKSHRYHPSQDDDDDDDDDAKVVHASAWAEKLIVVKTSWVEACQRENRRVPEEKFQLVERIISDEVVGGDVEETFVLGNASKQRHHHHRLFQQSLPVEILKYAPALEERCNYMIQNIPPAEYCSIFSGQSFLLVGFDNDDYLGERERDDCNNVNDNDDDEPADDDENDDDDDDYDGSETQHLNGGADISSGNAMISSNDGDGDGSGGAACGHPGDVGSNYCLPKKRKVQISGHWTTGVPSHNRHSTNRSSRNGRLRQMNEKYQSLKISISKLIRRAGGTIFWEPNEWITTVVLHDHYSKSIWCV